MSGLCFDANGIPEPCDGGFTIYNSYATDPRYQKYFTWSWLGVFGLFTLLALPKAAKRSYRFRKGDDGTISMLGVFESWSKITAATPEIPQRFKIPSPLLTVKSATQSLLICTLPLPSFLGRIPGLGNPKSCNPTRVFAPFSMGTFLAWLLVPGLVLAAVLPEAQLSFNPNRFGFIALACLPPVFLLSSKGGPVAWLTRRSYAAVNFMHRWLGRALILLVILHFSFWGRQFAKYGQFNTFITSTKSQLGLTAFGFLCLIAVSSLKPIRKLSYSTFFVLHYVGIIGFLVYINQHTIYAKTWATYSIMAIYVVDITGRLAGLRIRHAEVTSVGSEMASIKFPDLHHGWRGGQFVNIRLFFFPAKPTIFSIFRLFEQHPFSIANAPPSVGLLARADKDDARSSMQLFARSCGVYSWTGDLLVNAKLAAMFEKDKTLRCFGMIEGPYGDANAYDLLENDNILLVAGGNGMSFVLGMLDEIAGRAITSQKECRCDVVWVIRDRAHVGWFSVQLQKILDVVSTQKAFYLYIQIFVTCDPSLVPESDRSPDGSPSDAVTPPLTSHTYLRYARPVMKSLVNQAIDRIARPCGNCYPICRCGDKNAGVCCDDDDEKGCAKPELPTLAKEKSCCDTSGSDSDKKGDCCEKDEKSCCDGESSEDSIEVMDTADCCAPNTASHLLNPQRPCCRAVGTPNCCQNITEGVKESKNGGDRRIRRNGLGIAVCGPSGMHAELGNAVAGISLKKKTFIGGISLHTEHYSV